MSHSKVTSKRKKNKRSDLVQDTKIFLESALNGLVSIYMLLLMVVMPFYFTDGYSRIGTNKFEFFYEVTTKMSLILIPVLIIYMGLSLYIYFVKEEGKHTKYEFVQKLSLTDWFALGYGVVTFLSYLCSEYKEITTYGSAWKGANGWFMGLFSQLTFVAIYFLVSRFWKRQKWMAVLWIPVTLVVFVLGYLNRFSLRPIDMAGATPFFISTIGNINWYCGYIVTVLLGITYYIWSEEEKDRRVRIGLLVWLSIGFATLLTQGSQSGILALGVVLLVLYFLSMKSAEKLQSLGGCILCMGLACVGTWMLRVRFPKYFNYQDSFSNLFTNSPMALVVLTVGAGLSFAVPYLQKKGRLKMQIFSKIAYIGCMVAGAGLLIFLVLGTINTLLPEGLGPLAKVGFLTFDANWGSKRGATWAAAIICLQDQDPLKKLIGVGPDCMAMYIHSGVNEELLALVKEHFGSLTLTNAHNEWLTIWVNGGLLGLCGYAGIMVTAIVRYIKAGKYSAIIGACGFSVLAYTVNNMVSFQQAMSAVTVFLVLGMGEAYIRGRKLK